MKINKDAPQPKNLKNKAKFFKKGGFKGQEKINMGGWYHCALCGNQFMGFRITPLTFLRSMNRHLLCDKCYSFVQKEELTEKSMV